MTEVERCMDNLAKAVAEQDRKRVYQRNWARRLLSEHQALSDSYAGSVHNKLREETIVYLKRADKPGTE